MAIETSKRDDLPKLTYNESEANYITGTSRQTRWRARQRGDLRCVETVGRSILYTLDMLTEWVNGRREHRRHKRNRKTDKGSH